MKAPTLYHGTSLSGILNLIKAKRLPTDRTWGVVGDFSASKRIAGGFAEEKDYPKTPEDKVGVLVQFKSDFATKAKLYPVKYNRNWLKNHPEVRYHITHFNPDVMDNQDERDSLPSAKMLAEEKEWVGDNDNFSIGTAIEKVLVVDPTKKELALVKKRLSGFKIETVKDADLLKEKIEY